MADRSNSGEDHLRRLFHNLSVTNTGQIGNSSSQHRRSQSRPVPLEELSNGRPPSLNFVFISAENIGSVFREVTSSLGGIGGAANTPDPATIARPATPASIFPIGNVPQGVNLRASRRLPRPSETQHVPPPSGASSSSQPVRQWASYTDIPEDWLVEDSSEDSDTSRRSSIEFHTTSPEDSDSDAGYTSARPDSPFENATSSNTITLYPVNSLYGADNHQEPPSSSTKAQASAAKRAPLPSPVTRAAGDSSASRKASGSTSSGVSSHTFGRGSTLPPRGQATSAGPGESSTSRPHANPPVQPARNGQADNRAEPDPEQPHNPVLYNLTTPISQRVINGWARAAHLSMGRPNTQVRRMTPRPRRLSQGRWFVVTKGRMVGVFSGWAATEPQVNQFSGAIFKAYPTREIAEERFREVQERRAVMPGLEGIAAQVRFEATAPVQYMIRGPQNPAPQDAAAIVVFKGLVVGVYKDWLDCADYVVGIPGSVYNTFNSVAAAEHAFQRARDEGLLQNVYPDRH
ncbi:hypothetical protein QCA50_013052 [Cerrena zonata]|uniref:Ribonuclease H1 N-terminal domain-containing protein n=1 Tax=Cerrena zonata TaxID=2478898 RepID=A0AAW0FSB2_9APHY